MPRLTIVFSSIGRSPGRPFVRSWQQEPLAVGVLAALTPPEWEVRFFDDRVEKVDDSAPTDLVAISIETYTAKRGYQIASHYRRRGVPVVMGGYHATFCPDEVLEHADAVCVGEAENVWGTILEDAKAGRLKKRYQADQRTDLARVKVDRSIFRSKNYMRLALVETGRGCPFQCGFCSVSSFYNATYRRRPIPNILEELQEVRTRIVFFVDDNLTGDMAGARSLFSAVKPLGIRWITQTSLRGLEDKGFVREMAESGCMAVLIGFESLDVATLAEMKKATNRVGEYRTALANLREAGIFVYGTFVFGYPHDTPELYERSVRFAQEEKMFLAAFNHLVPFPGTPLHKELESSGRLEPSRWWLRDDFHFGEVPFEPLGMSAAEVENLCLKARRMFYSVPSILKRALDFRCNCRSLSSLFYYFTINRLLRKEVSEKRGIPLGFVDERQDLS